VIRFGWRWEVQLTWRWAAVIFGGAGLVMLYVAGAWAWRARERLRTWPLVQARVDSAEVVTPAAPRQALYGPRYRLTYALHGAAVSTVAASRVLTSDYASVAREVERAIRSGTLPAIVNPADAHDLELDPGVNGRFFFDSIIMGTLGLVFTGFGALFLFVGRREGLDRPSQATLPVPPAFGAVFATVMGVLFLGGAVVAARETARPGWTTVVARVDSADVVEETDKHSTTYAPRLWLDYAVSGRSYHAPLDASWSSTDYDAQARRAGNAARAGTIAILVSPGEPYAVARADEGRLSRIAFPAIFGLFAVLCFGMAVLFRRGGRSRGRAKPRAAGGPTPHSMR
jgi:hypothetical protein